MRCTWVGEFFELDQVRADDLDRVGAFDAGQAFFDIVLNILREVQVDAGEFGRELPLEILDQIVLVPAGRPFLEGLQGHEEFRVEKAGGVAAVVGPAVLGHDGNDLGMRFAGSRACGSRCGMPASSEMVGGMEARIHRLPSSSAGRNSVPSRVARSPLSARKTTTDHDA